MNPNPAPTVRVVTATEAQNKFGAMLKRTYASAEHLIIERDGIPVAALIPIADYQRLAADSSSEIAESVAAAGKRETAAREMKAFLEKAHAAMPAVPEREAERVINAEVAQLRYSKRRTTRARRHK